MTLDGYAAHVQFKTLYLLMSNRILVLLLPSHLSHVLQPLDVSVFSACKSYLQREIFYAVRGKNFSSRVLDAFEIVNALRTHTINPFHAAKSRVALQDLV